MSEIASHSNHNQQLAVFLDRDGTLFDVPNQFEINPKTIEALKQLQNKFQLFILSNECAYTIAGVPPLQAEEINTTIDQSLSEAGIQIKEWFVYSGEKKKITEYIELCKHKYELNLENSFLINDHPNEEDNARELGITQLYLLTSRGGKHLAKLNPETLIFHKIQNVASWIFNHPSHREALDAKIHEAANVIKSGGVAAFPTETVYGLGADVFQPDAVAKIFMIKGRPQNNPLIAHIADYDQLAILVDDVPDKARILMDAFWPGPLTIVFPKKHSVPDIVTANIPTVAVRMPAQPIARKLIRLCNSPLAAPSANRFTCTSPTSAGHVIEQLGDKCPVVIDGGACRVGLESTVVSFTGEKPVLLRPGGITIEEMEAIIGPVDILSPKKETETQAESPGMMPNHYAPATKLLAFKEIPEEYAEYEDIGVLLFKPSKLHFKGVVEILSQTGDTKEAAANFFAAIQRLDKMELREIVSEYAPNEKLGIAINNRLGKAANGRIES